MKIITAEESRKRTDHTVLELAGLRNIEDEISKSINKGEYECFFYSYYVSTELLSYLKINGYEVSYTEIQDYGRNKYMYTISWKEKI